MNAALPPSARPSSPLAACSLALGILALLLKVATASSLVALLGVILGILHLKKPGLSKPLAFAGIGSCVIALFLAGTKAKPNQPASLSNLPVQPLEVEMPAPNLPAALMQAPDLDAWVGVPVPDLTVSTLNGETIRLSTLKGKRVLLDFWATWCPPCVMEIPHFIELRKQASGEDLVIVGIAQEAPEDLKSFIKAQGINYPVASTSDLPRPFSEIESIPTTFSIDRKGIIQRVLVGYHDLETLRSEALAPDYQGTPKPAPVGMPAR